MAEQRIDPNTASAEELTRLPGIGPVLAQRIITYRDTVRPFDEPGEITAVSGIGQQSFRAMADRLKVIPVSTGPSEASDESAAQSEAEAMAEATTVNAQTEEESPGLRVVPPGESISTEASDLGRELSSEGVKDEVRGPRSSARLDEEAASGDEGEGAEEGVARAARGDAEEAKPGAGGLSTPWWRRLSWVWSAILGGLLGMIFALVVWAGINGSLDVGHSRAVLEIEGDVDGLAADVEAFDTELDGLERRVETLEGLTARVESVEVSVESLGAEMSELRDQADALEEEMLAVSDDVQALSEEVDELRQQAERTQDFFRGLQALLIDIFGRPEGGATPPATPTPEGK